MSKQQRKEGEEAWIPQPADEVNSSSDEIDEDEDEEENLQQQQQQQEQEEEIEDDDEEEVATLLTEVEGLDANLLRSGLTYSLIGIEGETPVLRLGNDVFIGEFTDCIGTDLFFNAPPPASSSNSSYSAQRSFKCLSSKRLKFKKVTVTPKQKQSASSTTKTPKQ